MVTFIVFERQNITYENGTPIANYQDVIISQNMTVWEAIELLLSLSFNKIPRQNYMAYEEESKDVFLAFQAIAAFNIKAKEGYVQVLSTNHWELNYLLNKDPYGLMKEDSMPAVQIVIKDDKTHPLFISYFLGLSWKELIEHLKTMTQKK